MEKKIYTVLIVNILYWHEKYGLIVFSYAQEQATIDLTEKSWKNKMKAISEELQQLSIAPWLDNTLLLFRHYY